jgi:hypothetical protein
MSSVGGLIMRIQHSVTKEIYEVVEESENFYIIGAMTAVRKSMVDVIFALEDAIPNMWARCALCGCNEAPKHVMARNDDNIPFCDECMEKFDRDGYAVFI